jgi:hypothetical protein
METISTTPDVPSTPPIVRSTFLTVICILTFIGSGWGLISAIRSYAMADTVATVASGAVKEAENQMDQQNTPDFAKKLVDSVSEGLTPENIRKTAIFEFISNLLTLFGAILMWNQRKIGFYMYIVGILLLIIIPMMMMGKLMGAIGSAFIGFIGVIFIVMYGVNLKYMNK